jgi:hypothetical protein
VHDFNPGIASNGVFWVAPIDPNSVHVNPGAGKASLHLSDFDIDDYGNVVNALTGGKEVDASVSLDVSWSGVQERLNIRNKATHFAGEYVHNSATLSWSASEAGFSFVSNPLGSDFAEVGHERNGVFFPA